MLISFIFFYFIIVNSILLLLLKLFLLRSFTWKML
jgi:hypothetical protein